MTSYIQHFPLSLSIPHLKVHIIVFGKMTNMSKKTDFMSSKVILVKLGIFNYLIYIIRIN